MIRILPESMLNMRDIGGVFTKLGKQISLFKIIRSNLPINLTKDNIDFLIKNGIKTIIDVRTYADLLNRPNILNQKPFSFNHIEMKGSGYPDLEDNIPQGYIEIIDDTKTIKKILEVIGETQGGVIINCSAGKDRTGIIVMLLLLIANAYDEDIIADYQISYTFLKNEIIQMHLQNTNLPSWLGNSKAEYMENTLKLFRSKYGNINDYLQTIGLDNGIKSRIYDKLIN